MAVIELVDRDPGLKAPRIESGMTMLKPKRRIVLRRDNKLSNRSNQLGWLIGAPF